MSRRAELASEAAQHASAKSNAAYMRQWDDDLKMLAADKRFRRFIGRLIFDTCHVMVSADKPTNAEIYLISGRRQIGESLLASLELLAPAETRQMVDEWFTDRFDRRADIERAGTKPPDGDEE